MGFLKYLLNYRKNQRILKDTCTQADSRILRALSLRIHEKNTREVVVRIVGEGRVADMYGWEWSEYEWSRFLSAARGLMKQDPREFKHGVVKPSAKIAKPQLTANQKKAKRKARK